MDFRQTVQFNEKTWDMIHDIAEKMGTNTSQTIRLLIRQVAKEREDQKLIGCV
jgi:antitoxin component of RelBE/YafQ-DinJ toxin-antitoxin module